MGISEKNQSTGRVTPIATVGAAVVVTVMAAAVGRFVYAESQPEDHFVQSASSQSHSTSIVSSSPQQSSDQSQGSTADTAHAADQTTEVSSSVVSHSNGSAQNSVNVNGTQYTAAPGESMHHNETSDDGTTHVEVTINNNNSGGTSYQSTSTNMNTYSQSSSVQFHSGGQ